MEGTTTPTTFSCKQCGAPVSLRAPGFTVVVACNSCGTLIDVSHPVYQLIDKAEKKSRMNSAIPLGARGKFKGVLYELIGIMVRSDATGVYNWAEYLLYSPYHGFRWLMCYNGNWTFIKTLREPVMHNGSAASYRDQDFDHFLSGKARVEHVWGEFYWRVRRGNTVEVADYTKPPYMLSLEKDATEIMWSLGEWISGKEVFAAFGIDKDPPEKEGVGTCEPNPYAPYRNRMLVTGILFVFLAFVMQVASLSATKEKTVFNQDFYFSDLSVASILGADLTPGQVQQASQPAVITPSFEIPDALGNLGIKIFCPVDNTWAFFEMTLVNENTGEDYSLAREIAYYYGTDSDGSWSEGSKDDYILLGSIPGGKYHLEIMPSHEKNSLGQRVNGIPAGYSVRIERHSVYLGNFFFVFFLLIIPVIFVVWRHHAFETRRWAESDYAPVEEEDDDE